MRLSAYRIMWVFVFFDLPVDTKALRKEYTRFHKGLQKQGFEMLQYSVYIRHAPSLEAAQAHVKRIENILPKAGKVSIMLVTDKQFERIKHYWGVEKIDPPGAPQQIAMF